MLTGSLFAGLMMDIFQLRHAFPSGAILMMLSTGLFFLFAYPKNGVPAEAELRVGPLDL
jgi:hypothetical protein